jgi:uncharacterized protein (TIGR02147 family)
MEILDFSDYKLYLKECIKTFPKGGRGQARKLAAYLNVTPMVVSHILTRDRHFTPDQAYKVARHFGLSERDTEYFLSLINRDRTETRELRGYYERKLEKIREDAKNIRSRVEGREFLTDEDKGIFYSNWYYTGISVLASIKGYQTVNSIADYLGLSPMKVGEVVAFLLATGICVEENGKLRGGKTASHLGKDSPFINGHRRNWREKALQKFSDPDLTDMFFSGPVSLSNKDSEAISKQLLEVIESFSQRVKTSPEERAMCLNIDWFRF